MFCKQHKIKLIHCDWKKTLTTETNGIITTSGGDETFVTDLCVDKKGQLYLRENVVELFHLQSQKIKSIKIKTWKHSIVIDNAKRKMDCKLDWPTKLFWVNGRRQNRWKDNVHKTTELTIALPTLNNLFSKFTIQKSRSCQNQDARSHRGLRHDTQAIERHTTCTNKIFEEIRMQFANLEFQISPGEVWLDLTAAALNEIWLIPKTQHVAQSVGQMSGMQS